MDYLALVTILVTYILGVISKKVKWINNNLIPVQNLLIGCIMAVINWIITKDFSVAIALSGLLAGGVYDLGNNLRKIILNKEKEEEGK